MVKALLAFSIIFYFYGSKNRNLKKTVTILSLVILLVLILDQVLKIWVKTHMYYGESFSILGLSWAQIHFVENDGAAFGLSYGGETGKLILSTFRIIMVSFLFYMLYRMAKTKEPLGFLIFFAFIIAGAMGNIIDSIFYGQIFSASPRHTQTVAELFPAGGGYGKILHGLVVDMLHFPFFETRLPDWFPFWGGRQVRFFAFVFNIADAAISTGVIGILLFHRKYFTQPQKVKETAAAVTAVAATNTSSGEEE